MSDLGPGTDQTVTCPRCGAQNDADRTVCRSCGASVVAAGTPDAEREDLELVEVVRGFGADGYDTAFGIEGEELTCPRCGARFSPTGPLVDGTDVARDTPTARTGLVVLAARCPGCGLAGHAVLDPDVLGPDVFDIGATERSVTEGAGAGDRAPAPGTAFTDRRQTAERPLGTDRKNFITVADGDTRSLRDRGPLLDEDGTDIREYTGEPVETEEGTVIPQQQNVGPGNEAGEGEWPDPNSPPAQPKD